MKNLGLKIKKRHPKAAIGDTYLIYHDFDDGLDQYGESRWTYGIVTKDDLKSLVKQGIDLLMEDD